MGIFPAYSGVTAPFCLLSLSHQIHSLSLQPRPALEIPTFFCLHRQGSKSLAEENQVFFPAGARQHLISGLVTSELGLSRLDTLWSALPLFSWTVDIPMASEKRQYSQKLKMTLQ